MITKALTQRYYIQMHDIAIYYSIGSAHDMVPYNCHLKSSLD